MMHTIMKAVTRIIVSVGLLIGGASYVQAAPNGHNVTLAQFSNGSFEQVASDRWVEFGAGSNQPRFTFQETNRDDWSVYLADHRRGVRIQLDLHRRWIRYADSSSPSYRDLYPITCADARINGRMVREARFAQGALIQQSGNRWVEVGADGRARFNFRETHRDMWSVYMTDDSRGVKIQIDMHRRLIRYADRANPRYRDLYAVTGDA